MDAAIAGGPFPLLLVNQAMPAAAIARPAAQAAASQTAVLGTLAAFADPVAGDSVALGPVAVPLPYDEAVVMRGDRAVDPGSAGESPESDAPEAPLPSSARAPEAGVQTSSAQFSATAPMASNGSFGGDAAADEIVRFGERDRPRLTADSQPSHSPLSAGADVSAPSPSHDRRAVRREDEQPEKRRREREKREPANEPTAYTLDDIVQFAGDTIAVHRQDMRSLLWPF